MSEIDCDFALPVTILIFRDSPVIVLGRADADDARIDRYEELLGPSKLSDWNEL
jgi:hypothetical protein